MRTHTVNWRRRQAGVRDARIYCHTLLRRVAGMLVFAAGFSVAPPVLAIPSPDLVVNLSASVAQILGLVTVLCGGLAVSVRRKLGGAVSHATAWRNAALALSAVLLIALAANIFQYTHYKDADNRRLTTNLVRASTEVGKRVGDASLKTLSFSGQLAHPKGLPTAELARQLD